MNGRTISSTNTLPSEAQWQYVEGLRKKLHLTTSLLDNHCVATFKRPLKQLDRSQVSDLIDEMKSWEAIPSALLREAGQRDLPGFGE